MLKQFLSPTSIEEAVSIKEKLGDGAHFLAGGTMLNSRNYLSKPTEIISLDSLELDKVHVSENEISIGSMCTAQFLVENENVPPPLKEAGKRMTNRNIRNMATIGGNLVSRDSCSDLITTLVALDAKVELADSKSWKTMSVIEYIQSDEKSLITGIKILKQNTTRKTFSTNFTTSSNRYPILTVAVSFDFDGNYVQNSIIAVGGVEKNIKRLNKTEELINGKKPYSREELEKLASEEVFPVSDLKGSKDFKKYLAGVLVASTFHDALNGEKE